MATNRSRLFIWVLLGALLLFAIFEVWRSHGYQERFTAAQARQASKPIPVGTATAKVTNLKTSVGAGGQVLQYTTVTLTSRIAGTAQKVTANVGDTTRTGEVLIQDDKRSFEAALDSSKAALESARSGADQAAAALKAVEKLKAKGMATELEVINARVDAASKQAALEAAKVQLLQAQLDLEGTSVASPVNGIVLARFVNANEHVTPNQILMQLGNLEKVYLLAQVQEEAISSVHQGQTAEVFFSAFPTTTFKGTVERIDPRIDPKTRAFTAYVAIDNPQLTLKPGLTGFARVTLQKTALAVPTTAVVNPFGESARVFVVNPESRAMLTPVRVGMEANGMMEIVSGLHEGAKVVSVGTVDLRDKDKVAVELSR